MRVALASLGLLAAAGAAGAAGVAGADGTLTVCTSTASDSFDIAQSQMAATLDTAARAAATRLGAHRREEVSDALPGIPAAYPQDLTAVHDSVPSFVPSPQADLDIRNLSVAAP